MEGEGVCFGCFFSLFPCLLREWFERENEMYYFQISKKFKYGTPLVALLPLNKDYFNPVPAQVY